MKALNHAARYESRKVLHFNEVFTNNFNLSGTGDTAHGHSCVNQASNYLVSGLSAVMFIGGQPHDRESRLRLQST